MRTARPTSRWRRAWCERMARRRARWRPRRWRCSRWRETRRRRWRTWAPRCSRATSRGGAGAAPGVGEVGMPVDVAVQAASPAGMALKLRYALPAGVQVDTPSLTKLVNEHKVSEYEVEDGALTLSLPPRGAGEPFQASFR